MSQLYKRVQKSRWLLIFPFILMVAILYLTDLYEVMKPKTPPHPVYQLKNLTNTGYLVHTPGCRIPDMNPFDPAVIKYYRKEVPFRCSRKRSLIRSNQTSVWIAKPALVDYNVTLESISCCYTPFWRTYLEKGVLDIEADNKMTFANKCVPFVEANVYNEFIRAQCTFNGSVIYMDYHAFMLPREPMGKRVAKRRTPSLSVLIIGMDAVSRLNFLRHMRKTKEYLKQMKAVAFGGYNKVHDNTFPNLLPLLSGYSVDETKERCWPTHQDQFDNCTFVWSLFNANGYLTAFGEDAVHMGTFTYLKNGFSQPPTDYYPRTYIKANEDGIGHSKNRNAKYCAGTHFALQIVFDYALKFALNMTESNKKFWGLFWGCSLTHDYLNPPANADDIYVTLLRNLKESKALERTALFFMSDHGMRWGGIRETYQGRLEERLPFLYVVLPDWFREKYPEAMMNLQRNTRMLTTHFDTHETMKDMIDLSVLEAAALKRRRVGLEKKRGISLFLPIPESRTCATAGITNEWCTCHESKSIPVDDALVVKAAQAMVDHINSLLFKYIQCSHLDLKEIHSASIDSGGDFFKNGTREQIIDYIVILSTVPGNGKFEGIVRYHTDSKKMKVQGYVSRINLYGSQNRCILDYNLKLYCYCH